MEESSTGGMRMKLLQGLLEQLNINSQELLIQVVGFALLAFLLTKFLIRPINALLEERARTIKSNLDEAEKKRQEMVAMRDEYERRIADIESEARERIQEAVRQAHEARDKLLADVRAQAERLLERAREEIAREREKAIVSLRDQVADLAVDIAGRIIEKSLDESAHRALIDDILNEVRMN